MCLSFHVRTYARHMDCKHIKSCAAKLVNFHMISCFFVCAYEQGTFFACICVYTKSIHMITSDSSPYSCKVMTVKKSSPGPNGETKYRFVQSLVELSGKSIIQNYHLAAPRDQLNQIKGQPKIFAGLDLRDSVMVVQEVFPQSEF